METNTPAVSVEMCLSGRDLTEPKLSPDGTVVALVARWGSGLAIITVPVDGGPERIVTTHPNPAPGRGFGGGCFEWLPDGSGLLYAAADGNIWLQPYPGGTASQISDVGEDRRAEAPTVAADGSVMAAVIDQAEVWIWSLAGSEPAKRVDTGDADFCFDPFITPTNATLLWTAWNIPDMPWDAARVETFDLMSGERGQVVGAASVHQPRSMSDGRGLGVRDDTGWLNVWLGDEPLVDEPFEHAGPTWGMGQRSYVESPDGDRIAFVRNEAGFGRLCVVDLATRHVDEVGRGVHGQLSWKGDRLVALRSGARTPTQIVSYDTNSWTRRVLAVGPVAGWDDLDLPEPELMTVEHDGVLLHARRYVAGEGRTLCWVHGGPTDQWQVEFMPRVAYWWSRGWDVLVPDPRGTTGHGRSYQQALHGGWGVLDVDDTAAILRASHENTFSSPDQTVMMGSSSGGLTVLGLLAHHRGLAAGGVTLYPVTDLAVLAEESHRFEAHYTHSLVGPIGDRGLYDRHSPISYTGSIDVPLLIMHGDSDPVVPLESSRRFAERVAAAGGDIELIVMEGEGHGFRDPVNKRADYEHTARFLGRVVGAA